MNLSQWMQKVYRNLGKVKKHDEFVITGGSTSTIIDTKIATRPTPYDDDYGIGYTAFIVRDAGGASAAPENEFAAVTGYASSTNTFSFAASSFTVAPASGDKVALVNDDIPVQTMIEQANMVLTDLGRIELVDSTSLTTVSSLGDWDYTLPTAAKYSLRRVEVKRWLGDSYQTVYDRKITPSSPNATGLLTLPAQIAGLTIKLWYEGVHPTLTAYNSVVSETIDDNLAVWGLMAYALQWYNNTLGGRNDHWNRRGAEAWNMYNSLLAERPVVKSQKQPKFFSLRRARASRDRLAVE